MYILCWHVWVVTQQAKTWSPRHLQSRRRHKGGSSRAYGWFWIWRTVVEQWVKACETTLQQFRRVYNAPQKLLLRIPAVRKMAYVSRVKMLTGQLTQWVRRLHQQMEITEGEGK